jgi:hypothetical protein
VTYVIEELKLFAIALKMNSAFLTVDKRSQVWIDEGWSVKTFEDLRKEATESEGAYTFNELKNKYLDLKDDFEKAVKDLRGKLLRFEQDASRQTYLGAVSPILRYERKVDQFGVKGKLFLGLNSPQAKGYRIIELDYPRWLEQLMQTDPDVFRSENLSEGEVYALVPSRGIDNEKISVLRNDFWEEMEKSGIPAFDTFRGYKELKPEFSSRLEKTIDKRYPFDTNVLRIQALVEQIKREHALAVPGTRAVAVGPPVSPIKAVAPVPSAPMGRKLEDWYLLFAPHLEKKWIFNYQYRSSWDTKDFNTFEEAKAFIMNGSGNLYLHAYRGVEPARWSSPVVITMFKLKPDEQWESGEGEDRHYYHLQQPYWTGLMWMWRISSNYKWGQIYRNEELKVSEAELINGKYGYGGKKPEPGALAAKPKPKFAKNQEVMYQGAKYTILDLAFQNGVWLYELNAPGVSLFRPENEIQPAPPAVNVQREKFDNDWTWGAEPAAAIPGEPIEFYQADKNLKSAKAVLKESVDGKYYITLSNGAFIRNLKTNTFLFDTGTEAKDEFFKQLTYTPPTVATKRLTTEDLLSVIPYRDQAPEVLDYIRKRLTAKGISLTGLEEHFSNLLRQGEIYEPIPNFYARTEETPKPAVVEKTTPKFKVGDMVTYRQGTTGEATFTIKKSEFEDGKWFYVMTAMRGAYPYRIAENELVVAAVEKVTPEEAKEEAKLEKEAEEDREIPEEPDQTVYVVVLVSGGVAANEKGEMKIETPEFIVEVTTKELFAKYGDFNDEMWMRPLAGVFGVPMLDQILKDSEVEYDAIEDNEVTWGNDWDSIRESLADNPSPFNKYALFHVKWRPEDLHWTQTAADTHDVYHHKYTKEELLHESKHHLQVIAKVKDLSTSGEQGELIDRIATFNPEKPGEPEEKPPLIEQKPSWKKGMPLTDDQIEQAKEDALMHIADYYIPRNTIAIYDERGKDAAVLFLKQQISNYGQGGPDEPDITGSPKGVWVTNEVMTPNEADSAPSTAARLITYPDLLNFILHNREAIEANIKKFKEEQTGKAAPSPIKPTPAVPVEKPAAVPTDA